MAFFFKELEDEKLRLFEDVMENQNLTFEQFRMFQGLYLGLNKAKGIFERILSEEGQDEVAP